MHDICRSLKWSTFYLLSCTLIVYICDMILAYHMHRFTPEEKAKRHPCAHMPFGYGPRNCVGMRFALLEAKMALIEIVSKFRIVLAPETKVIQTLQL